MHGQTNLLRYLEIYLKKIKLAETFINLLRIVCLEESQTQEVWTGLLFFALQGVDTITWHDTMIVGKAWVANEFSKWLASILST
jgi:hypothetical protein